MSDNSTNSSVGENLAINSTVTSLPSTERGDTGVNTSGVCGIANASIHDTPFDRTTEDSSVPDHVPIPCAM